MPPNQLQWTNRSVLKFAGDADPILLIEARARELVLLARDSGWSGPPYNPLAIADLLKIPVEANGEVDDARTVPAGAGVKIEFNPTRPRERVRFSIAHEIAHTLFPDVAEQTRYRGGAATSTDDWQLEMLCNLAAAEFVMPVGSLPPANDLPRLEQLMIDRRKFDVSTEAFLIRVIKTTTVPAIMFCTSPIQQTGGKSSYRLDYIVRSKSAPAIDRRISTIPAESVVHTCTAIGQTNHAVEAWLTGGPLTVECVGIPGFPGTLLPRVAGIAHLQKRDAEKDVLRFLHGNVLSPTGTGAKVICQLVNDQARNWGGGVARMTAQRYPAAQEQFARWILQIPRRERLGRVHFAEAGGGITIASLVAQEGYGPSATARIRYAPLEKCLVAVARYADEQRASVHMPRIGAGQSGGSWETVEEIIRDALIASRIDTTVYDLPPKRQSMTAELLI